MMALRKRITQESNSNGDEIRDPSNQTTERTEETTQPTKSICSYTCSILKYVILIILIPPFLNHCALQKEYNSFFPNGTLYDIGFGQKLYLSCKGRGSPTLLFDAPTGLSSDVWVVIFNQLAMVTKVCAYDRSGLGFSERPYKNLSTENPMYSEFAKMNKWKTYTLEKMVDDIHKLLSSGDVHNSSFIYVGSQLGAMIGQFYSQIYEDQVSDLVMIDPLVDDTFVQNDGVWHTFWYEKLLPSYQIMHISAATGLTRLLLLAGLMQPPIYGEHLPQDVIDRQKYLLCSPHHVSSIVEEHFFINESFHQMKTLSKIKAFPNNVSVTVITGNYDGDDLSPELRRAWAKSQQSLIEKLSVVNHIVINGAYHHMLYKDPDVIIRTLKKLVKQSRSKSKHKFSHQS